jgi:tripartite-type tricarboxylate transporter receptor subunit TctC
VLTTPEIVAKLEELGITATPGTPEQFGEQMRRDLDKYGKVVKAAGIKAD